MKQCLKYSLSMLIAPMSYINFNSSTQLRVKFGLYRIGTN